ncbi:M48 family metallopeptidase [Pseudosulfitobacter koreensis]|uniref:M48 family metallopeptidase n=1 Tax=Pseudosulfitobacter koreensis TaxID=2968472 RepID=A0ABT1YW20_9RHOB|nr:SprT family zinc-dependent metalloprotease [Pseudosulfitobacter koreense]MCR8825084.1 M48 family metallopeptidase [Pseudosulfitobacter koreense]
MAMHLLQEGPPVEVVLRRSARARRISLRVSSLDGRVTLTLPKGVAEREAMAFARAKEDWIRGHLQARLGNVDVIHGAQVPLDGQPRLIVQGAGRRVVVSDGEIAVPGAPEQAGARLQAHLKALARTRLAAASDLYAARLGRPYQRISIRDTRSRWGSCSSRGTLMYSWRLVLMPQAVLDYVAAHEVAHLEQMNHSQAFWDAVTRIYGSYGDARAWLRQHGSEYHRFRFGD